jgi:hypothetical protein
VKSTAPNSDKYARTLLLLMHLFTHIQRQPVHCKGVHSYSKGIAMYPDQYGNIGYGLGVETLQHGIGYL